MRQLMPIIIIVLISLLVISHASVNLSGDDGMALLKDLTNISMNIKLLNNTTANLSDIQTSVQLSGANGTALLVNLTNSSSNPIRANRTGNLTDWGSEPHVPPLPSSNVDRKLIEVLRLNHGIV
jgi:hypothetical protein